MPVPVEMARCICSMIRRYVESRLVTYTEEITASLTESIIAALASQGGLYIFRPTVPLLPDFTLAAGDFTTDGAWHELDLTDILPAAPCCARFFCVVEDNLPSDLEFRRPAGAGVEAFIPAISAGRPNGLEFSVNLNGQTGVEYRATNTVWTTIELTLTGWFRLPYVP